MTRFNDFTFSNEVSIIDILSGKTLNNISIMGDPEGQILNPATNLIYVLINDRFNQNDYITVINDTTNNITKTISLPENHTDPMIGRDSFGNIYLISSLYDLHLDSIITLNGTTRKIISSYPLNMNTVVGGDIIENTNLSYIVGEKSIIIMVINYSPTKYFC